MTLALALVLLTLLPSVAYAVAWNLGYESGRTDAELEADS